MLFVAGTNMRLIRTFRQRSFSCLPWRRPQGRASGTHHAYCRTKGAQRFRTPPGALPGNQVAPRARIADLGETASLIDASSTVKEAIATFFAILICDARTKMQFAQTTKMRRKQKVHVPPYHCAG
jgi:hypothetical protein